MKLEFNILTWVAFLILNTQLWYNLLESKVRLFNETCYNIKNGLKFAKKIFVFRMLKKDKFYNFSTALSVTSKIAKF